MQPSLPTRFPPFAGLLAVAALALSGCASDGPLRARLSPRTERPERAAVLFIVDGMAPSLVEEGCRDGWLPNFQKRFVAGGTRVRSAITCIPSITYPAMTTMLTGASPARHGIMANKWFEPQSRLYRNYATIATYDRVSRDHELPTLFELLAPDESVSIQSPHTRGLTRNFPNWAVSGAMWLFGAYTAVDRMTATTVEDVAAWANAHGRWPELLVCYFPGVDTVGHRHGLESPEYREAVRLADHQVGRVVDWLESQKLLDRTLLVLVSDHGLAPARRSLRADLLRYVRESWGLTVTDEMRQDGDVAARSAFYDRNDAVVVEHGVRLAMIHLREAPTWDPPPTPTWVAATVEGRSLSPDNSMIVAGSLHPADSNLLPLWRWPGIDAVAYARSPHEVQLRSPRGDARIVETHSAGHPLYAYLPEAGDPLGYLADARLAAFVRAGPHPSRDWLDATAATDYPDAVPQLVPLLRNRRAGQVLVFAAPGYSFSDEHSGHGGIHRLDMRAALLFAGPDVPRGGELPAARVADITPTILEWLQVDWSGRATLDGVALFSDRRAPAPGRDE